MSQYKAEMTLIISVLVLFGVIIAFATGVFDPMIDKIGDGFTNMVDNVFSGVGMNWGGAGN